MKNIIWTVLLAAMILISCGKDKPVEEITFTEDDGIFFCKVGQFEVYTLIDGQREGNAGILIDADELLPLYIPEEGFLHSTNVFLIKTPGKNILIDTGFGNTIFEKMNKLGAVPEDINAVLLTHLHGDHIGGLQKDGEVLFPNAAIYLSALEYAFFTQTNVNQGAVETLALYGDNVITFEPAELGDAADGLLPGITAIANYGHTPGHTIYLIENGDDTLIIAGDFLHVALVQFAVPEISAIYDVDPEAAAFSRRQILDYAAQNNFPIGAMHFVYPGIVTVDVQGEGFSFNITTE